MQLFGFRERADWKTELGYNFITGGAYGVTTIAVEHPFDTVKTQMHASKGNITKGTFLSTCTKIAKTDGFLGFYRGLFPPI